MKFKKLFRKKSKHTTMVDFLVEIFTPVAKFAYGGKVIPSMMPMMIDNKLSYTVIIVNDNSQQLAKFVVPIENILKG